MATSTTAPSPTKTQLTLGRILGLALLGLAAFDAQNTAGSGGPSMFENPSNIASILGEVASIWSNPPVL